MWFMIFPVMNEARNVPFLVHTQDATERGAVNLLLSKFAGYFRGKRLSLIKRLAAESLTIVDFGGTPWFWQNIGEANVVLLNLSAQSIPDGFIAVTGDGRKTEFADRSFELAFSNSTIEHVGTREDQLAFARELRRVGRRVYCQTPARWFFFEPHYFTPFVHWTPLLRFYWFVRYCTWYGLRWKPNREQVQDFQAHLRLLTRRDMKALFPDCEILRETFLGMTKSFIAVRNP